MLHALDLESVHFVFVIFNLVISRIFHKVTFRNVQYRHFTKSTEIAVIGVIINGFINNIQQALPSFWVFIFQEYQSCESEVLVWVFPSHSCQKKSLQVTRLRLVTWKDFFWHSWLGKTYTSTSSSQDWLISWIPCIRRKFRLQIGM